MSEGEGRSGSKSSIQEQQVLESNKERSMSIYSNQNDDDALSSFTQKAAQINENAIKVSFKNICYTVTVETNHVERDAGFGKTKNLQVLKNCTGYALPGQSTYIMGASGAGKTSLLNCLSDRINMGLGSVLTGDIMLNDRHRLD
jgi:ATP-binding cassette, subfamily G (WHITE), eye pigment precursor transporter